MTAIKLDDLDRDELLFLIRRHFVRVSDRDLWRARWEILTERASSAMTASSAARTVWLAACDARRAPDLSPQERSRREAEYARTYRAMKLAERREDKAHAASEAAYAALDATR